MSYRRPTKHHIDSLMVLLLFGVFATCVLSVLLTGANAYRQLTLRDEQAYNQRTCMQYIATKVRQIPSPQALSIGTYGDGDAILLSETIGGELYLTRIYCCNGWVRELFSSADGSFIPEDGEKVTPAQNMALSLQDGLLSIDMTHSDGSHSTLNLFISSGEGASA